MVRSMLEETPPHLGLGSGPKGREEEEAIDSGELIKDVAAVAYLAGSDTTVAAIESFFLAMLVYPNVQLKAQAEIDRVVGRERLPNMDDIASLPYVNAVVTECLRWLPVTPMGMFFSCESFEPFLIMIYVRFTSYDHG
jgi:cytochrome P450